jgi:Uncharacterised nucleotidyltransferase
MLGTAAEFDAEFRLLLACSKLPADEVLVRNLAGQVQDWEKFLRYAEWHELAPLVCHTLISDSGCSLAPAAPEHLVRKVRANAQQNLFLTAELLRIMRALLGENIRAIPYKGPVLAASAYGNLANRNFCDLDILLSEEDVHRARSIMLDLGYRGEYSLTPVQEAKYLRTTSEYNFLDENNQVQVEIHWRVVPIQLGFTFDFGGLWSRTKVLPIGGSRLRVLSSEDLLLVLSVHAFKHSWAHLKWVCDVAMHLSSSDDLDWTSVLDEADRIGALRVVLITLSLANQLFGSNLSDPILIRLSQDSVAGSVAEEIVDSYKSPGSMSRLKEKLLMLRAFSGFRNRATYMRRVLLDPTMEEAVMKPERPMSAMRTRRVLYVARQAIFDLRKSRRN